MRLLISAVLMASVLTSACSKETGSDGSTINPVGPTGGSNVRPPQTGVLAFSTTAGRGWSSIDIYVDSAYVGTLRQYFGSAGAASCRPDGDARVMATLTVGFHTYTARSDTGASWSGTHTVEAGSCMEINLTCTGGDCSR